MQPAHVARVITPKKLRLNGLWYGGKGAKVGLVFLHGLTSTAFAQRDILSGIANKDVAVLTVSNRGHDKIAFFRQLNDQAKKGYDDVEIGEAHEVFTDCVDDIDGAVSFMHQQGVETIYLLGHSTGCQKAVYYLSRENHDTAVKGAILLCAVSDYAYAASHEDPAKLKQATEYARKLITDGKPHQLLPPNVWPEMYDAQRFLSLHTPDSEEEIFSYAQPEKKPVTLQEVTEPLLVIYAGGDEYSSRPIPEIITWFKDAMRGKDVTFHAAEGAPHDLDDAEEAVAVWINEWLGSR